MAYASQSVHGLSLGRTKSEGRHEKADCKNAVRERGIYSSRRELN